MPIVHVNADDPEAALGAVRLALAYRAEFGHDFVIDLVGYRRFGHNEQDDASLHAAADGRADPGAADRRASCTRSGSSTRACSRAEEAQRIVDEVVATLRAAHERLRASIAEPPPPPPEPPPTAATTGDAVETAVARRAAARAERAAARASRGLHGPPEARAPARAAPRDDRRRAGSTGGRPRRSRSRRCSRTGSRSGSPARTPSAARSRTATSSSTTRARARPYAPIQHLPGANASFEVYNSPLSEYAALGFEYGYSVAAPDALVLWEAQFGDFVNGAQIVIDQFIVAGRSKWGQTSRLTLLLPHGYEGNGPGALERAARAVPPARRAGEHPHRRTAPRRPSSSTSSAGRRSTPSPGRSS